MQPLAPEREPALALSGKIERGVLEPTAGAAAVESDLHQNPLLFDRVEPAALELEVLSALRGQASLSTY